MRRHLPLAVEVAGYLVTAAFLALIDPLWLGAAAGIGVVVVGDRAGRRR